MTRLAGLVVVLLIAMPVYGQSFVTTSFMSRHWDVNLVRQKYPCEKNPGIGFEMGRQVAPPDLGIVGYAVMSCRTMRDTLQLWNQYAVSLAGMEAVPALFSCAPPVVSPAVTSDNAGKTVATGEPFR